jgi:hypothetical protein
MIKAQRSYMAIVNRETRDMEVALTSRRLAELAMNSPVRFVDETVGLICAKLMEAFISCVTRGMANQLVITISNIERIASSKS